jgi:NADH dehydrogenase FAD-containing subunit
MVTPRAHTGIQSEMPENIVIIGAGQAGQQAVQSLRSEGFKGAITMVGDEAYPPYQPFTKKPAANCLFPPRPRPSIAPTAPSS